MSEAVLLWSSPPNTRPKHSLTHGQPTRRLRLRPHRRLECVCVLGVCAPRHCLCVCVCVSVFMSACLSSVLRPPIASVFTYVRGLAVHGVYTGYSVFVYCPSSTLSARAQTTL